MSSVSRGLRGSGGGIYNATVFTVILSQGCVNHLKNVADFLIDVAPAAIICEEE